MIAIGDRVRYIRIDSEDDKATGFYPPVGTHGTVVDMDETSYRVQWDQGVKLYSPWWCGFDDVKEVFHYRVEVLIGSYRFSRECNNADDVYDVLCDVFLVLPSTTKEWIDYKAILAEIESGQRISYNECPIAICRINGEC